LRIISDETHPRFIRASFPVVRSARRRRPVLRRTRRRPDHAVDWSKGDTQAVTLAGNRTFTFSNGQKGGKYLLILKQDATGSRTVTWLSSVRWPGVTGPTLTTTAGKTDYLTFFYNGATYDGIAFSQNY
jgi:hypothetical protein